MCSRAGKAMITEGVLAGTWRAMDALVETGKRLAKQDYNSVEERHSKSGPRQDTVGGAGKSGGEGGGGGAQWKPKRRKSVGQTGRKGMVR